MSDGEATTSVRDRLRRARRSLLDLSTRYRLLNVPTRTRNVRTTKNAQLKAMLGVGIDRLVAAGDLVERSGLLTRH